MSGFTLSCAECGAFRSSDFFGPLKAGDTCPVCHERWLTPLDAKMGAALDEEFERQSRDLTRRMFFGDG